MASNTEIATSKVIIDGQQAEDELKRLTKLSSDLKKQLTLAVKSGDDAGAKAIKKQLSDVEKEAAAAKKELNSINTVMNNLNGSSLKQLQAAQRQLNAEIRNSTRNTTEEIEALKLKQKQYAELSAEINKVKAGMNTNAESKFGSLITKAQMAYFAVTAVAAGVVAFGRSALIAFEESEKANRKLLTALGGNKEAFRDLAGQADKLRNKLGIDDEVTKGLQVFGLETGKNTEMVKRMIQAATELSALTGEDLDGSFKKINATFNGSAGRLTRLDAEFGTLTKTQLENGGAVDLILKKYSGLAEQSVTPTQRIGAAWNELKETIGGALNFITPVLNGITSAIQMFNSSSYSATDQFKDQVSAVADLTTTIDPLLTRYDELKSKSSLSKTEQTELKSIIDQVAGAIPGAVSAFDDYGNAIGINTTKARAFINEQVAMMGVLNKKAIDEATKEAERVKYRLEYAKTERDKIISSGTISETTGSVRTGYNTSTRKATSDEIKEAQDKYAALAKEYLGYTTLIKKLNGDALKDELAKREQDEKSLKETEAKKLQYKKYSLSRLQKLADEEDQLAINEIERRKGIKGGEEAIKDAMKEIEKSISNLDTQINNAIASGNLPLAEKFMIEKKAAEELYKQLKETKELISKGWDMNQRDLGSIDKLISIGTAGVTSDKEGKSPLKKRKSDIDQGPTVQTTEDEAKAQQLREDTRNAEFQAATDINNAIFNIVSSRQQAEYDQKISLLEKQREKELSNKNLTEEQKAAINKKYDDKERKIKQDAFKKQRTADIIQNIINTALAVTKALPNIPLAIAAGIAGLAETAVIISQPVPQFFTGHNVTGALDGNLYKNVPYVSNAATGLYQHPTLIGDHGSEIVIDHQRSRNITMNYPEIMEAISSVPQHYSGRVPDITHGSSSVSATDPILLSTLQENTRVMKQLMEKGVKGDWNLFDLEKIQNKKSTLEDSVNM